MSGGRHSDVDGHDVDDPGLTGAADLGFSPDCQTALRELYGYLDGELTTERLARIEQHLGDCTHCLAAFDFEAEVRLVVAHRCRDEVPEELRRRIAAAIRSYPEI